MDVQHCKISTSPKCNNYKNEQCGLRVHARYVANKGSGQEDYNWRNKEEGTEIKTEKCMMAKKMRGWYMSISAQSDFVVMFDVTIPERVKCS
jgi:hypothetical protein